MTPAPIPESEQARLATLYSLSLLDTSPDQEFDDVVLVAKTLANTETALVSLVDSERQWFKAKIGLNACETSRDVSFCAHAILTPEILWVEDARLDPRFAINPLVTGNPDIRFYAGAPLEVSGHRIGSLCVLDSAPRAYDPSLAAALSALARSVSARILARQEGRIAMHLLGASICMLDPDGRVTSWNPGSERTEGYQAHEIVGEHISRFYTEEDRAAGAPDQALRTARATGRFSAEGWRVRKDGSCFWAHVLIDAIRNDKGELIGFARIIRDMSEQRQAQLASLESERRFRLLVQGVTDYAIYMLDPDGLVTNWNAGAQRIKHYTADEIVGQPFSRFYTAEDILAGGPNRALETARREGRYEAEGWRVRKSGERFWAGVVIDAIRDDAGELIGFAKITRDLTERRKAQELLDESREQLFQSQKMEAVGQLAGGVAHDFNNLLQIVDGYAQMALARSSGNDGAQEAVDEIIKAAARGAALVKQLLVFSRRQVAEKRVVTVSDLLRETRSLLKPLLGAKYELNLEVAEDSQDLRVETDPGELTQVVLNLSTNARDAMPGGGRLDIGLQLSRLDETPAARQNRKPGDYAQITLSDHGQGMSPETMAKIFEPFFSTKEQGKGTGLGLAMVYGFVEQSQGLIDVKSQLGLGTTFRILLPAVSAPASAPQNQIADLELGSGETILLVEDEKAVLGLVKDMLERLGYNVLTASDGMEAMELEAEHAGAIDLMLSDLVMPHLGGIELSEILQESSPDLPIVLMSGHPTRGEHQAVTLPEGVAFLQKPFKIGDLASTLCRTLNKSVQVSTISTGIAA